MMLREVGYIVLGTVRSEQDYDMWKSQEPSENGGNVIPVKLDLTKPDSV